MARFFIFVIVYALAVFSLPRWGPFDELMGTLSRIDPRTALYINAGALIAAGGLLYFITRKPNGWVYTRPSGLLEIFRIGLVGVLFATIFDILQGLSGRSMEISSLPIIPPAFMAGEAVYVGAMWGLRRIKGERKSELGDHPGLDTATATEEAAQNENNDLLRLIITVPIYVFVILFLPRQEDFKHFASGLINIPAGTGALLSGAALIIAIVGGGYFAADTEKKRPEALQGHRDGSKTIDFLNVKLRVYLSFFVGLAFAGLINLAGYVLGYAPTVEYLIVIPLGTLIAELAYQLLAWRLKYGPSEI